MANGDTKTNQYLDIAANGTRADLPTDTCCETRTQTLIRGVAERIMDVEDEVEELKNNPDVADIVATYSDLQDYDTSKLTNNAIIRVLADETHDGASTYYRYNKRNDEFTFIGEIDDETGFTELSSDDYNYPTNNPTKVALWMLEPGVYFAPNGVDVAYGNGLQEYSNTGVYAFVGDVVDNQVITYWVLDQGNYDGFYGSELLKFIFAYSSTGEIINKVGALTSREVIDNLTSVSTTQPLSANQGKALKALIDSLIIKNAGAPTTATVGTVGQLLEDTTNGKLYQCTSVIPGTDPNPDTYTWTEIGSGGGGGGGIIELTSADYNWNSTAGDSTTEPFDCVALWLLNPGQYTWKDGVAFKLLSTWTTSNTYSGNATVWDAGGSLTGMAADYRGAGRQIRYADASGVQSWGNNGLLSTEIYQGGDGHKVRIGYNTTSSGTRTTAIGTSASATATDAIVIGTSANTSSTSATDAIVIGNSATTGASGAIVIGKSAQSNTNYGIAIGNNVQGSGIAIGRNIPLSTGIVIGDTAEAHGPSAISIGSSANASATRAIAIGDRAEVTTNADYSVALGSYSQVTQKGEVGIGLTSSSTYGYNNSPYRLLTGLYDPQSDHDAATKGYVDTTVAGAAYNPTISNNTLYL